MSTSTLTRPAKRSMLDETEQRKDLPTASTAAPSLGFRTSFLASAIGCALLYLSFAPVGCWPLAWAAALPWTWLAAQSKPIGRSGYWAIWSANFAMWLALLWGVNLAHILLVPGWLVLAAYIAVYLPLFVGATRTAIHTWRWPVALAAPLMWVGLELARGYVATGFSLCLLTQSQMPWTAVVQIADVFGPYGTSFVMVLFAGAVVTWVLPKTSLMSRWMSTAAAIIVFAATLGYGFVRLQETPPDAGRSARLMLVQGCIDTVLDGRPEAPSEMVEHYRRLTFAAIKQHEACDLVVWPESAFAYPPDIQFISEEPPPSWDGSKEAYREQIAEHKRRFKSVLFDYSSRIDAREERRTHFFVGGTSVQISGAEQKVFNAALLISPQGDLTSRYQKNHLVMFGEYVPFVEWLPSSIKTMLPIGSLGRGDGPTSFEVAKLRFAPCICFEDLVPQLIRRHINTLADRSEEPDVIVNTTNDGWFRGTALLDLHFQGAALRAIENRKPLVITANTGISGIIDSCGRIMQRGPNHDTAVLLGEVHADGRQSLYRVFGDWPAFACSIVCLIALLSSWWTARSQNRAKSKS